MQPSCVNQFIMFKHFTKANFISVDTKFLSLIERCVGPFILKRWTSTSTQKKSSTVWWQPFKNLYMTTSFVANSKENYRTTQLTETKGISTSWVSLLIVLFHEKIEFVPLSKSILYISTLTSTLLLSLTLAQNSSDSNINTRLKH